ncbi:MAG: hypothetical protein ACYSSI_08705 [Planctomycetota bacterium]|jgi:hypothetical protein
MRPADNIRKLFKKLHVPTSVQLDKKIYDEISRTVVETKNKKSATIQPNIWRIIMNSKITKLVTAAVIIIAVILGLNIIGGSIDGASVAWAEIVQRVEQSHNEYYTELLLSMEAKDMEKATTLADKLSDFWAGMGILAEAKLDPAIQLQSEDSLDLIREKAFYYLSLEQNGRQIFLEYANEFIDWLNKIENIAWTNEIFHICRQLEEYAEEIREPGRHPELDFSYAKHCLPGFVTYCQWFEQLPWDNPNQNMTPAMILTRIQRDLEIARREIETLKIRGTIPFVKRCVQQAQKNILDLDKKIVSSRTKKQRDLCRQLDKRIDELCALIIYAEVTRQDFIEQIIKQNQHDKLAEKSEQVLTKEFDNKGSFADYYIERIDQSLDLCEQLLAELEFVK